MNKYVKLTILILSLLVIAAALLGIFGFQMPYQNARSTMPAQGEFVMQQQEDGSFQLNWPEADRADYYCVEIFLPAKDEESLPEMVYKDFFYEGTSCVIPQLPTTMELTLSVNSVVEYETLGENRIRFGDVPLTVTTTFDVPVVRDLISKADAEAKTVTVDYSLREGDHCRLYLKGEDGEKQQLRDVSDNQLQLVFGDQGELPIPEFGGQYEFEFDAYRTEPGLRMYGTVCASMTVVRDDLLGRNLNLQFKDEGYNVVSLTWDETKGEHYEVQMLDESSQQWETIYEVAGDGERSYTSPHLPIFREFGYRVVAVGGQTLPNSDLAAVSEEITFETKESPIFTTIWPVQDLEAYRDTDKKESVGKVKTAQPYCVLEEKDGMFAVRLNGEICYIDSNYCMINLPEYIGELCKYDITNSYASLYMVHEFEIPEVTDVITAGYENVELRDGEYLVPLLYRTAKKLTAAAKSAIEQGYRIKIYDAYRPNKATLEIYDLTEKMLEEPLPEEPFTDVNIDDLNLPEPRKEENEEGEEVEVPLTYADVMTNGTYGLTYFLAKGGSLHNLGIAIDMTIESLQTGAEVKMQTSMHDLSHYSVLARNTSGANRLASIMKAAGFNGLISEWWHFQDDEIRKELKLPTVWGGVHAACWMADDNGWRYRTKNGSYYVNCTATIENVSYVFDENGYVVVD